LTSYKIESFYVFPFYLSIFPTQFQYIDYLRIQVDTKTQILINKLENVQVEAARIVTGGTRLVSLSNLYIETGWEKLKDRRERHRTIHRQKVVVQGVYVQ
jgi:hypothetical protein